MSRGSVGVGQVYPTKFGPCKVLTYEGCFRVQIKFLDTGTVRWCIANNLRTGKVQDYYVPTVKGIGYMGEGEYSQKSHYAIYTLWTSILGRSCTEYKAKHPTYAECSVVKTWHNFQTFAAWCVAQPNWDTPGFELDKDLRVPGNKKYGPKYCSFVPHVINCSLMGLESKDTGVFPRGNLFRAVYKAQGKSKWKSFVRREDAEIFYRTAKLKYIKNLLRKFKHSLHPEVVRTLTDWRFK